MTTKPKGVMIKGMEMPKNCCECFCCDVRIGLNNEDKWEVYFARCKVKIKNATRTKRPSWCPLQEVQ